MRRYLLLLLFILSSAAIFAQDVSQQTEQKRRIEEEIDFIDNQLKAITSKQKASTQQLTLLQKKISNRKSLINQVDYEIRTINDQITQTQRGINRLNEEIDTLSTYYSKLVYNAYKNRNTKVWFMYLLSSENIGQGLRRFAYMKNLSSVVAEQAEKIKEKQAELEAEKERLAKMKTEAQAKKISREKEYKTLLTEEKSSKKMVNDLSKDRKKYEAELKKKRQEVAKLNKEIERILSKTVTEQQKDKTQIDYALSDQFSKNRGKLPWPVKQGVVTGKFGIHNHPVYKNLKLPENNGIDITTDKNASAYSVFDGVVKQILVMPGYNQCVLVQHGEFFTFYCKLSGVSVKSGQKIKTGDKIGIIDAEGSSSVLHFQIWKGTTKQNPESWLN